MRKDVKTGMLAGTILCLTAVIWFCAQQQIITQPLIKFDSQNFIEPQTGGITDSENDNMQVVFEKPSQRSDIPAGEQFQQQLQKTEKQEKTEAFVMHTVAGGQTLSDISKIYYNTPNGWKKIYEANKEQLSKGPDAIRVGMKLTIPQ